MASTVYREESNSGEVKRIKSGLTLYREHAHEIYDVHDGYYIVPGSGGRSYLVHEDGECECADYVNRLRALPAPMYCKHYYCLTVWLAKHGQQVEAERDSGLLDFTPFETETLDGVYVDGITALEEHDGQFLIFDYPITGDRAGECIFLDGFRDFERAATRYEEITGCMFTGDVG